MVAGAANEFGDVPAIRDDQTSMSYAQLADGRRPLRGRAGRVGGRTGRPGRPLVLQLRRLGGGRPRHLRRRRRPDPGQHQVQGARGGRSALAQPGQGPADRHGLPRHRLRRPVGERGNPAARPDHHRRRPGSRSGRRAVVGRLRGPGDAREPRRGGAPERRAHRRRPVGHPLHVGHHGSAQGRRHDPRAHAHHRHRLGGHDRPFGRRRLSPGEPVLPHVRAQGGHLGQCGGGGDDAPRAGVRRGPGPLPGRLRAGHGAARSAHALPVHPRPPGPGRPRPRDLARRRHRCGRHPGRADPAGRCRTALLQGGHRLRADRGRDGVWHLGRRRRGGGGHHGGASSSRVRGAHRRRGWARGRARRGRRGPPARREHHAGLPRRPRRDGQGAHGGGLAAHGRPRVARRGGSAAHRGPGQGHVHRGRLQRLSGGDRERPPPTPGHRAGRGDRRPRPTPGRGGDGLRRAVGAGLGRGHHRLEPRADGQLQGAPGGHDRRHPAAQRDRQGDEGRAAPAGSEAPS